MTKKKIGLSLIFLLILLTSKVNANVYLNSFQEQSSGTVAYIFWTGNEECFDCEPVIEFAFSTIKENFPEMEVSVLDYNQPNNHSAVFEFNLIAPMSIVLIEELNGAMIKQSKIDLNSEAINEPYFKQNLIYEINNFLN